MKRIFKAALVVAIVAVAGIGQGYAQQKLAHINSGELLSLMPEMQKADAAYQDFYKQKQTLLETMNAQRTKMVNSYTEKKKTLSEANQTTVGKELDDLGTQIQDLDKRLQETSAKADEDVKAKQSELYQPVFDKATAAIKAVSKEKGYAYVFDTNAQTQVLLYFDGGEDILPLVKAKLGIPANAVAPTQAAATPGTGAPAGVKKP